MSWPEIPEACPHCDATPPAKQLDTHVAREHADLPPCTARIDTEYRETYTCGFRVGHDGGEYGTWHASKRDEHMGRNIWNDTATGATPHRPPEPRVRSLAELKAMGVLSHTVVATGEGAHKPPTVIQAALQHLPDPYRYDSPERPMKVACAALHTDANGNTIPCPGYPHLAEGQVDEHQDPEDHTPTTQISITGALTAAQRAEVVQLIEAAMRQSRRRGGGLR